MAIDLAKCAAMWYTELLFGANLMAGLVTDEAGYVLHVRIRFRRDEKAHDSADKRIWFEDKIAPGTAAQAIGQARRRLAELMKDFPGGPFKLEEFLAGADGPEGLLKQIQAQPWAHSKTENLH